MKWIILIAVVLFILVVAGILVYGNKAKATQQQNELSAAQLQQQQLQHYLDGLPATVYCNPFNDPNCGKGSGGANFSGVFQGIFSAL